MSNNQIQLNASLYHSATATLHISIKMKSHMTLCLTGFTILQ